MKYLIITIIMLFIIPCNAITAKEARDRSNKIINKNVALALPEFKREIEREIKKAADIGEFETFIAVPVELLKNREKLELVIIWLKNKGFLATIEFNFGREDLLEVRW